MDIMGPRDSLGASEHEILFLNSDEFMVDFLRSPKRSQSSEVSLEVTSPVLSPESATRRLSCEGRDSMKKQHSFTSRFKDGVTVKAKPPPSPSKSTTQPNLVSPKSFRKTVCTEKLSNLSRLKASKYSPRKAVRSPKAAHLDTENDSLVHCQRSAIANDEHVSLSIDLTLPCRNSLQEERSSSKYHAEKGRKSAYAKMQSAGDDIESASSSYSFNSISPAFQVGSGVPQSPSSPIRSYRSERSTISNSSRRRKNSRDSSVQKSGWLASPSPTPSSRSARKSTRSRRGRRPTSGMPNMPNLDADEDTKRSPVPAAKKPPMIRPLDKILVRDFGSTTTATTFLSVDTDAVDYSMSHMFPMTKDAERVLFNRIPHSRDISIEKGDGEKIGYLDFSMVNQGKRLLKDVHGRVCAAIILNNDMLDGNNIFKICGNKPASKMQRLNNETGYYTWAEVKNSGSFGGKFVMRRFSEESSSCTADQHSTKPFGSLFNTRKSRGYVFSDSKKAECLKMVALNKGGRGILVAPNRDLCLMICFAAVVDEMIEHRMR